MIPATCQNCDPSQSTEPNDRHGDPNLGVVLGVLGALALTAVLVFCLVPVVRRRRARGRPADEEESRSSQWRRNSRRSSVREEEPKAGGPEALLPLLPEHSSFTWSDLRSKDASAESSDDDSELDVADTYSFPTNRADLSHNSSLRFAQASEPVYASVLGGASGTAPARASHPVPKRSLTPPGLPSKASPLTLLDASPTSPSGDAPRVLLPSPRPAKPLTPGADMEPVPEGYARDARSRPGSLQLPSPPASPPVPHTSHYPTSRSHAPSHGRTLSIGADFKLRNARPPLSGTHSAPATALPFRPPPSSTTTQAWWSKPTGSQTPSTAPLTSAFRSPLQRSGSQSTSKESDSPRYPSLSASPMPIPEATSPQPSLRARSGSVMSERPARTPQGARPKPVELLRTGSSTVEELRSSRRASIATPPSSSTLAPTDEDEARRRKAYLRSSMSVQTPRIEESRTPEGQSVAPSYFDARHHRAQPPSQRSTPSSALGTPLSADSTSSYLSPDRAARPADLNSLSPSRRSSVSHSHQPNLVRKKDSAALKPIPISAILHSPPNSPPRPSHSREGSIASGISRSRAGSIASVAGTSDASHRSRLERRQSVRTHLPPLDRLPPLDFKEFEDEP